MRSVRVACVLAMLVGCKPDGIASASCESVMLALGDPWKCRVTGPSVTQASAIHFDTESRNHVAHVKLALRVSKGALHVSYRDLTGDKQAIITPATPLTLEMQTRMHREHRYFTLSFDPKGGKVEGLEGTVDYSTP